MSARPGAEKHIAADAGAGYYPSPPPFPLSLHLLEVTVISAQDLYPAARAMRTYAADYVDGQYPSADRKAAPRTRLDAAGHTDPAWNEKFVLRVGDAALRSDTSAVTMEVYARLHLHDTLLGTARGLLSTLRPALAPRFLALQVRRPSSLRPLGMLNIGIALLDGYTKSLPIYIGLSALKEGKRTAAEAKLEKWKQATPKRAKVKAPTRREEERGKELNRRNKSLGRLTCFAPVTESGEMGGDGGAA